jgi:hypothetical protein
MGTDTPRPVETTHQKIKRIGTELAELCSEKNKAYGSSFDEYQDLGLVFRVFDKMMRVANQKEAFGESPWRDIAGYGMLGAAQDEQPEKKPSQDAPQIDPWTAKV